jgi:hypothetical protein
VARLFAAALLLTSTASALADVHYVDVNSTNATPPYTNWDTAATNIQDAVDAAVAGDEIVVTNGTYATGGRAGYGRVVVDKLLTVRSVNGPESTTIVGDPLFVDAASGNLRLQSNSPCINAGNNSYVTSATDLDGNPRMAGGTVDIGAYEFQSPASMISYAWLQQFNLPINPATDTADPDGDGVDNYHEWLAGTDPTNRLSSPAQLTIVPSGTNVVLTWSTNAVGFTLQSSTNLLSPAAWVTNSSAPVVIAGQNTLTNPITGAQKFYRLIQ